MQGLFPRPAIPPRFPPGTARRQSERRRPTAPVPPEISPPARSARN